LTGQIKPIPVRIERASRHRISKSLTDFRLLPFDLSEQGGSFRSTGALHEEW
jgi:hypothetical protein